MILGAGVHWGLKTRGRWRSGGKGRGLCEWVTLEVFGGGALKQGGNVSEVGRRNWRWSRRFPRRRPSGSVAGAWKKNERSHRLRDRREGVSRGRKLALQAKK